MACLGEIKDVLSFKLYFMQNIKQVEIYQLEKLYIT